ncbi:hypothetical protein K2X85_09550 [bacterium]|jgi:hypothetical protein|nr:hypothetical protein [bacterium]
MRRVLWIGIIGLILVGMWMASHLSFGFFGSGAGKGEGASITSVREKGQPHPMIEDGVLKVRIDGEIIYAGGSPSSVDEITRIAAAHQAKVSIERSPSAIRRPREELERTLRDRNVHVVIE